MEIKDIENIVWCKESYKEFVEFLLSLQDLKYKEFSNKLSRWTLCRNI